MNAPAYFNQTFKKKYLFTITSKLSIGGILSESKVEIRWLIELKEIFDDGYLIEFITLDNTMVETNNEGFTEIHHLVNQLQKAFNEISFISNFEGKINKITNKDIINDKWNSVKKESIAYNKNMTSLNELFALQDENFNNEEALNTMINSLEFFEFYFGLIFGKKIPLNVKFKKKNVFGTTEIPFEIVESKSWIDDVDDRIITFKSNNPTLKKDELEKAYGGFPFISIDQINPVYQYDGQYRMDKNIGHIKKALITFKEYVSNDLNSEINYNIAIYE
ncbi:hypothetical protein [Pedobacter alluvionis]|uniref:Uncharacterized protein n=1 Tax=Pedobacter alluvionis TaxID=475253 RepID=A0A497YAH5_9SPHI|nr:hypothetical protein [Pedobacter alluvionis]RLJ79466.1 hypothetical protein BCL90_0163 [Pedobacter alluvionis]TFB30814.1 hypothetical protein E3V97_09250 [Pedobacter alluvionis]